MDALVAVAAACAAASGFLAARWALAASAEARRRARARSGLKTQRQDAIIARGGVFARMRQRRAHERVCADVERHVPEMLDAVALGMRSGLSFESAFRLYCFRFDDELALACRRACQRWESGLTSRDDALRDIAAQYDVAVLARFVANATRCLRFGSPMGRMLEVLSSEARSCYRAKMEERVAKAPVKMLMPTAALILPAMLVMMMGPVVLELVR